MIYVVIENDYGDLYSYPVGYFNNREEADKCYLKLQKEGADVSVHEVKDLSGDAEFSQIKTKYKHIVLFNRAANKVWKMQKESDRCEVYEDTGEVRKDYVYKIKSMYGKDSCVFIINLDERDRSKAEEIAKKRFDDMLKHHVGDDGGIDLEDIEWMRSQLDESSYES